MEREGMSITEFSEAIVKASAPSVVSFSDDLAPRPPSILTRFPYIGREWLYYGQGGRRQVRAIPKSKNESNADTSLSTPLVKIIPDAAAAGKLSGYGKSSPTASPPFDYLPTKPTRVTTTNSTSESLYGRRHHQRHR